MIHSFYLTTLAHNKCLSYYLHTVIKQFDHVWYQNQKTKHNHWDFEVQATKMCKRFFKLTWCLQRGFCWAHSMRNIWENYIWQSKIRTPVFGIWNHIMSHLCIVFFGMGDKNQEVLRIHVSFAKIVATKNCRQKQKTKHCCSRRSFSSLPWSPPKKKLVKMSLQWSRYLTLGRWTVPMGSSTWQVGRSYEFVEPPKNWPLVDLEIL